MEFLCHAYGLHYQAGLCAAWRMWDECIPEHDSYLISLCLKGLL